MATEQISRREFANPANEYRPMPFWFLNSKLQPQELLWQIDQMREKGLGGFFLHARFGLETEYMSEEWLDLLELAIEYAHKFQMQAWLYDEYPYPSGIGGLKVTQHVQYRNKFIDLIERKVEGPGQISIETHQGDVLAAYAIEANNIEHFYDRRTSLMDCIGDGAISWQAPKGSWLVMVFLRRVYSDPKGRIFAPDYLSKEAMEYYFSTTQEVYKKRFKKYFGQTIPGIFTDEPSIIGWHQTNPCTYRCHHDGRISAWGQEVPKRLSDGYGHKIEDVLPAIFYDCGPKAKRMRRDYRSVIEQLYLDSFIKPYRKWCDENGLLLTGHLLFEEGLYSNVVFGGDYFASLGEFHIPGTDLLLNNCEREDGGLGHVFPNTTNVQGQKLVTSIAHVRGRDKVLSETFGASGWGLDLEDMKWISNWQYSLGINFMCPHAFFYSIEGYRKAEAPPSLFFQSTYWKYFRRYSDYIARLSYMLQGGIHQAKVALFYPLTSFKSEFKIGSVDETDLLINSFFDFYASYLLRIHFDYDIIEDKMVVASNIEDGCIKIAQESYEVLIIPPVTLMDEANLSALEKFVSGGGYVIFSAQLPHEFLGSPDNEAAAQRLHRLVDSPRCCFLKDRTPDENFKKKLAEVLKSVARPHIECDNTNISYIYKTKGEHNIYFFCNRSKTESQDVLIRINSSGAVEKWDLETGKVEELRANIDEGGIEFPYHFSQAEGIMVTVSPGDHEAILGSNESIENPKHILNLPDEWEFFPEGGNVLIMDRWNLKMKSIDQHQYHNYTTTIDIRYDDPDIGILLDDIESRNAILEEMKLTIRVNGEVVSQNFGHLIDKKFKLQPVSQYLKRGRNDIELEFYNIGYGGDPKLLTSSPKLVGNFLVEGDYVLARQSGKIKVGDWAQQGYPYFSGTAAYSKSVEIVKSEEDRYILDIGDVRDVLEVMLNGTVVKIAPWHPFEANITPYLKNGKNELVLKITNSHKNFMEGIFGDEDITLDIECCNNLPDYRGKKSGLLGPVRVKTLGND